ncbi:hypothetical protein FE156_13220 [Streptomyces albidoflavus]|nr:hypothetical protein FE156_13220 [Streptomyces albidoflavus]
MDAPTGGRINGAHGRAGPEGRTPMRPPAPPHVTGGETGADVTGGATEGRGAPRHPAPPCRSARPVRATRPRPAPPASGCRRRARR